MSAFPLKADIGAAKAKDQWQALTIQQGRRWYKKFERSVSGSANQARLIAKIVAIMLGAIVKLGLAAAIALPRGMS